MRPDGTVLSAPGYDPVTRLWNSSTVALPVIPDRPDREQAEAALKKLKDLLSGFNFVVNENDGGSLNRAVALSAMMTPVLRGAMDVAPLCLVAAATSGEGKTYLADLVAAIATGRKGCPVVAAAREEEMEKRLGAMMITGDPLVSIDNLVEDSSAESRSSARCSHRRS